MRTYNYNVPEGARCEGCGATAAFLRHYHHARHLANEEIAPQSNYLVGVSEPLSKDSTERINVILCMEVDRKRRRGCFQVAVEDFLDDERAFINSLKEEGSKQFFAKMSSEIDRLKSELRHCNFENADLRNKLALYENLNDLIGK